MWPSPLARVARKVACHFSVRAYCYTWAVGLLLHVPNLSFSCCNGRGREDPGPPHHGITACLLVAAALALLSTGWLTIVCVFPPPPMLISITYRSPVPGGRHLATLPRWVDGEGRPTHGWYGL